jgi:hypothetical protein
MATASGAIFRPTGTGVTNADSTSSVPVYMTTVGSSASRIVCER